MRWRDFINKRQAYKKAWEALKEEYEGDIRKYLNSSHLVIAYGPNMAGQFDFKRKDAGSIAMDDPGFFTNDASGKKLIELAEQYKALKEAKADLKTTIMKQLEEFDTEYLTVADNQAEIRFPALNMEFIQEVKKSKHCDKKITSMSKSSIRVILKADI